jgi:hypothetical protein
MSEREIIAFLEKHKTIESAQIYDTITKALAYKMFFDDLCGKGIMLVNWRMDGDLEPLDSLIESAEHSFKPIVLDENDEETLNQGN